jgi:hypothetical protein
VSTTTGQSVGADLRIAQALEYIAAQMGEINRKLDRVSAGFPEPKKKGGTSMVDHL